MNTLHRKWTLIISLTVPREWHIAMVPANPSGPAQPMSAHSWTPAQDILFWSVTRLFPGSWGPLYKSKLDLCCTRCYDVPWRQNVNRTIKKGAYMEEGASPVGRHLQRNLEFEEGRDKWHMGRCFSENVTLHFHYHWQRSVCTEGKKRGHLKLWEWLSLPSLLLLSMFVISWLHSTVSELCQFLLPLVMK